VLHSNIDTSKTY